MIEKYSLKQHLHKNDNESLPSCLFVFHHIGYAVNSLAISYEFFKLLGYNISSICEDQSRNIKIMLISDPMNNLVELIEPLSNNSPISNILKKNGACPYHLCYSSTQPLYQIDKFFKSCKFHILYKKAQAPLFDGKYVKFYYSKEIGIIEILLLGDD